MSLNFNVALSKKSCLIALLLIVTSLALEIPATSKAKEVTIRVCVKDGGGKALPGVWVTFKGGSNPVDPWKTDDSGCTSRPLPLTAKKQYSLEIKADGYQPAPESQLNLTLADADEKGLIEKNIILVQTGTSGTTPSPPKPTPSPPPAVPAQELTLQQVRQTIWIQTLMLIVIGVTLLFVTCALLWMVKNSALSMRVIENEIHWSSPEQLKGILQSIRDSLSEARKSDDAVVKTLATIAMAVRNNQPENRAPAEQLQTVAEPPQQTYMDVGKPGYSPLVPKVFTDVEAQQEYCALIDGGRLMTTPLYLGVDASSSPEDMLGNSRVQLKETPHGTFVLFRGDESDMQGWVFPNPRLAFDFEALKPIFSNISSDQFKSNKKSIRPRQVSQVSVGRWVVV